MLSTTHAILVLLIVGTFGARKTDRVLPITTEALPRVVAGTGTSVRTVVEATMSNYGEYLGVYDLGEHGFFGVNNPEGRLIGELSLRKGPLELFPTPSRPDQFYAKAAPATFVFSRNDKGRVDSLVISVAGKGDMKGAKRQ